MEINKEKLEKDGYTAQQINQILMAEKEGINLSILKPHVDIENFRNIRNFAKEKTNSVIIIENICEAINKNMDIDYIFNKDTKGNLPIVSVLPFQEKYGKDMAKKVYENTVSEEALFILYKELEDKPDLINFASCPHTNLNIICKFDLEDRKLLQKYIDKNLDYDLIKDAFNEFKNIKKPVINKEKIIKTNEEKLNLAIRASQRHSNTRIDKLIKSNAPNYLLCAIAESNTNIDCNNLNKDIEFFLNHKNLVKKSSYQIVHTYEILEVFNEQEDLLKLFDENFDKYSYESFEVLGSLANTYGIKDILAKEKIDLTEFFETNFSDKQKQALLKDFYAQMNTTKNFVINYVDKTYSAEQIEFLSENLILKKDITSICNSKYSTEHMRHKLFYNEKGIVFNKENEYDENYVRDKNNEYESYSRIRRQLDFFKNANVENLELVINWFVEMNKYNNMSIDIDGFLNNIDYIDVIRISTILSTAAEHKIDAGLYVNGKYNYTQMSKITEAIESGKDYMSLINKEKGVNNYER